MKPPDDKMFTVMRCWGILIPTIFFSIVTDTVFMFVLALTAAIFALLQKKPIPITLRTGIYGAVLALTIAVISTTIFKIENRFFMTPSEIAVPASLVFSMALLFYGSRPTITAGILILCVFSQMMSGDLNEGNTFKNLPLPISLGRLENLRVLYLVCLFLCAIPFFYMMNRSQYHLKIINKAKSSMLLFKGVIILISLALVLLIYQPTQKVIVPFSRSLEAQMNQILAKWRKNTPKKAFENVINLRSSYFDQGNDLDTILMRVESKSFPGYIRSRAYEEYFDGGWESPFKPSRMKLLIENHEYSFNTYSFQGQKQLERKELEKIEIFYSNQLSTPNILHMGQTHYLEMACESLKQTPSGTVTGTAIDLSGGITLYNHKDWTTEDPFPGPDISKNKETYLQIDDSGEFSLKSRLLNYFSDPSLKIDKSSPTSLAKSITEFFYNNFKYKLGVSFRSADDPIFEFLDKRKGHCEMYATTTVMLLRAHDIPARYVTGFYCSEKHPTEDYFLGRSRDLHAWVEYYDHEVQNWRLLEPTPPGNMPGSNSQFNFFSATWDSVAKRWQELLSNIVRGYFAESIILFLGGILDIFLWLFSTPFRSLISISLLIWFFYRRKKKKKKEASLSKNFLQLKKGINKLMQKISKHHDIAINPSMTLSEIAMTLNDQGTSQSLLYANCIKEYETLCYSESQRQDDNIKNVKDKITVALKTRIR
jgi:transglutaminase-like putative cysteine protease